MLEMAPLPEAPVDPAQSSPPVHVAEQEVKEETTGDANEAPSGVRGIRNIGQSCYLNAIVQVLTHTPLLKNFFLEMHGCDYNSRHEEKPCIIPALCEVFREVHSGEGKPVKPKPIKKLLDILRKNAPELTPRQHHDAHECFFALLAAMNRHFTEKGLKSIANFLFLGSIKSTITCVACSHPSSREEECTELSLEIRRDLEIEMHLDTCLMHYTEVEKLGTPRKCDSCKKRCNALKQFEVVKTPLILCIHLKRFKGRPVEKWSGKIIFPEEVDLQSYSDLSGWGEETDDSSSPSSPKNMKMDTDVHNVFDCIASRVPDEGDAYAYTLYAVVVHVGKQVHGGHYISYIKHNGHWYECDDEKVEPVDASKVLGCEAYLIFYHQTRIS